MSEPAITPEPATKRHLTPEEYQAALEVLGGAPAHLEEGNSMQDLGSMDSFSLGELKDTADAVSDLKKLLASQSIGSKNWPSWEPDKCLVIDTLSKTSGLPETEPAASAVEANATSSAPVDSTPSTELASRERVALTVGFKDDGDALILLGHPVDSADPLRGLGGSVYLEAVHGKKGLPPHPEFEAAKTLHTTLLGLLHEGVVKSVCSCGKGGLAAAVADSCFVDPTGKAAPRPLGATLDLSAVVDTRLDALLFGESQNRVVISVAATNAGRVAKQARIMEVPALVIGKVGGDTLNVKTASGEFSVPVAELHAAWWEGTSPVP